MERRGRTLKLFNFLLRFFFKDSLYKGYSFRIHISISAETGFLQVWSKQTRLGEQRVGEGDLPSNSLYCIVYINPPQAPWDNRFFIKMKYFLSSKYLGFDVNCLRSTNVFHINPLYYVRTAV